MKRQNNYLFFLCFLLLSSAVLLNCTEAEADENPTIMIEEVVAGEEDTIEVPVVISNNPGICGAAITFSYDNALTLTSIRSGSAFSGLVFTKSGSLQTENTKVLWDGLGEDNSNGEIAVLTFQRPAEDGVYEISASYEPGDIIDGNLDDLNVPIIAGSIAVNTYMETEPDLVLPASLDRIEEEAFMGGSFTYVKLDEDVTYIGERAFANCPNLSHIYIPEETSEIADNAFEGVENLIIHGIEGSYASTYAEENGFIFKNE